MTALNDFTYDRNAVSTGIAHIGVGNFHRAHEQYYNNLLLAMPGQQQWGTCGIALLPSDRQMMEALGSQKGVYTLTICGSRTEERVYRIGSLTELLWSVRCPGRVIDKLASPEVRIITLTITEGGYNIDNRSGEFIFDHEDIRYDLHNPHTPRTVFGFVAAGLRMRMRRSAGPVTILSCDNLQHNGDTARLAFTTFIGAVDKELAAWVEDNVTFPNSMVDRITPAVTPSDRRRLNAANGTRDRVPVYCEEFTQWVIEDKFAAGRPQWERVGVQFTDDVSSYENMKLSLLNASHTMLCYPALLAGYRKVDEAVGDGRFLRYIRDFMDKDVTPYVPAPDGIDLEFYKQTLIERFSNHAVGDHLSRICFDGASKIPVFIMPNLGKMVADGADIRRVAFFVAAYRRYLGGSADDNGSPYSVDEPWMSDEERERLVLRGNPREFLKLSPFASVDLAGDRRFVEVYCSASHAIDANGILPALESIL